ncbi:MAG: DUF4831 family protein [Bacteroidales bacterium]|nr:DUF4831 family protein [Bacteroidales bacterium]
MKKLRMIVAALLVCGAQFSASAQVLDGVEAPAGAVVYSLPSTTIALKVTAEHEAYQAGPYAMYAQKYLGIDVRQGSGDFYTIKSIEMVPYVEADPKVSAAVNLQGSKAAPANFLSLCSQGLVVLSDGYAGKPAAWRFGSGVDAQDFLAGSASNIDITTTTLYKTVMGAEGIEKVPVKQTQTVEKSLEKKAEETAELIFKLRQKRVDIITGDTDATFSGEAMAATLAEIQRLEDEYMSMFIGKSVKDEQTMVFDVVPDASKQKHMYIAFRLSDVHGLLPANNMQGRPFVLELVADGEPIAPTAVSEAALATKGRVAYRKPVTVVAKVMDGQKVLMQARVPVYQLGKIMSFPLDVTLR